MNKKKDLTNKFQLSKLYNKWIAIASPKDRRIIAYGNTPEEALFSAKDQGYSNPIATYFLKPQDLVEFGIN
jgi:hypothetical protein